MDTIPYDFIDRVFTKLNDTNHREIRVQSPLWMEVARVYKKKLQTVSIHINVSVPSNDLSYCLNWSFPYNELNELSGNTIDNLAHMDDRFVRIIDVEVDVATSSPPQYNVKDLSEFVRVVSRFDIGEWYMFEPPPELIEECLRNGVKLKKLCLHHFPEAHEFLKYQLQTGELRILKLYGEWTTGIKNDLETFVCRPEFRKLECDFDYLDMDFLKRIVAYWRTMDAPWKSAEVYLRTYKTPIRNFEIADWLQACGSAGCFGEIRGERNLMVRCERTYCMLLFD